MPFGASVPLAGAVPMPTRPPIHQPVGWRPPGAAQASRRTSGVFYRTREWKQMRMAVLKRDHFRCKLALPGCEGKASTAHHLIERNAGGADHPFNLISACRACHNRIHPEKMELLR